MSQERAFTLIETILAITVVAIVIVATAQLTQSSLKLGRTTLARFVAFHQAEADLEIVRNIRDSNWLRNLDWRTGLSDGIYIISEAQPPWKLEKMDNEKQYGNSIKISTENGKMRVEGSVLYSGGLVSLAAEFTDWRKEPF